MSQVLLEKKKADFTGMTYLNKIIQGVKLFFSLREFWMVYAFCFYAFLYGFLNQGGFDEIVIHEPMIVAPLNEYYITTASVTCLILWMYIVIRFVKTLVLKDRVRSVIYIVHIFLMPFLAEFLSNYGNVLVWALR